MSNGIGSTLRDARLARGEDLSEVAEALKIRRSHVVALESENFGALGAATYARGHLRNYARYLGLDPLALLAAYDAEYGRPDQGVHDLSGSSMASSRPREPLPRWIVVSGLVVVLLVALALIGMLGDRTPPVAIDTGEPTTAPTSGTASPAPETPTAAPTATPEATPSATPSPSPSPSPSPTPQGVRLLLAFEQDVWMAITVDGAPHPRSQTTFAAGDVLEIDADEVVEVRYGNAGGVSVELNGERLGPPGNPGEVVDVSYTPEGVEQTA